MRFPRRSLAFLFFFAFSASLPGQQTTTSSPQALSFLQRSLAALTAGKPITDVTLSGIVRRIVGPDDESGTAMLKAIPGGASRMDLSLPSGPRSEVLNSTTNLPAGSWSASDGASHPIAFHNLLSEPVWFFPAFAIGRRLSGSGFVVTHIGQEIRNGQAVEHISVTQTPPDSPGAATVAHLSQVDFFLDTTTFLPAAISFNIHPDNNALLDIPVEVRFNDYRSISGAQIPFHIQKFLNNSLLLDFQAQTATSNSGLPVSLFNVQ